MTVTIKKFEDRYSDQLVGLFNAFHDYLVSIDPHSRLQRLDGYGLATLQEELNHMRDNKGMIFLALEADNLVGFGVAYLLPDLAGNDLLGTKPGRRGRIEQLFVVSEFQGRGVARLLMEKMEEFLKVKGCNRIFVGVFAFNTNAHELYKHLGYYDIGIEMMKKFNANDAS